MKLNVSSALVLISLAFSALFFSCRKEGTGGKAKVNGNVNSNGALIPGAVVYIKFGATEAPGANKSLYDKQYPVDAEGNYSIAGLYKGNYYLYAEGFKLNSNAVTEKYAGGIAISLGRKESRQQDIAVVKQ